MYRFLRYCFAVQVANFHLARPARFAHAREDEYFPIRWLPPDALKARVSTYSLSDGGGWSKIKVSFSVSNQSISNHYYLVIWQQP